MKAFRLLSFFFFFFAFSLLLLLFPLTWKLGSFGTAFDPLEVDTPRPSVLPLLSVQDAQGKDLEELFEKAAPELEKYFVSRGNRSLVLMSFSQYQWFRISMRQIRTALGEAPKEHCYHAFLVFSNPHLSQVDCFVPRKDNPSDYDHYGFGGVHLKEREMFHNSYPVFLLNCISPELADKHIYIRAKSLFPLKSSVSLMSSKDFGRLFFKALITSTVFAIFLATFTLIYLFFFVVMGERLYLYFILTQGAFLTFFLSFNGYLATYLGVSPRSCLLAATVSFAVLNVTWSRMCYNSLDEPVPESFRLGANRISLLQGLLGILTLILVETHHLALGFFVGLASCLVNSTFCLIIFTELVKAKSRPKVTVAFLFLNLSFTLALVGIFVNAFLASGSSQFAALGQMTLLLIILFLTTFVPFFEARGRLTRYLALKKQSSYYRELSQKDALTGLYNRAYLQDILAREIPQTQEMGFPLSFIMLDIDHFKLFNDTWGHQEGDRALIFVAQVVMASLRESDIAVRYGGEEISIVLYNVPLSQAMNVAERIRRTCETQSPQKLGPDKTLTVSLGVAELDAEDTIESLIRRADQALYEAKKTGRNRTIKRLLPKEEN